jgi:mannosyl-3-phosphoglycerate phosphatase
MTEVNYEVIRLGTSYTELRKALKELQKEGFRVKGFGDMSAEEVARAMGFSVAEAEMAKRRDFDEPFLFDGGGKDLEELYASVGRKGLNVTKGKIYHLIGQSDKGKAVSILIDLYKQKYGSVTTVALGDSSNDQAMLEKVDIPIIVQKPDGTYDASLRRLNVMMKVNGIGPSGWNSIINELTPSLAE